MKELTAALSKMHPSAVPTKTGATTEYIVVSDSVVMFQMQNGSVKSVGVNGVQITDVLEFTKNLIQHFQDAHPCRENAMTITKIDEAILWQHARTLDRERRGVEGQTKN